MLSKRELPRFKAAIPFALGLAATLMLCTVSVAGPVQWKTGAVDIQSQTPAELAAALRSAAVSAGDTEARRVLVQFDHRVDAALHAAAAANGLMLLSYVGENAFFASIAPERLNETALTQTTGLIGVEEIQTQWKLHPMFNDGLTPEWAQVGVEADGTPRVGAYVLFHRDVDLQTAGLDAVRAYGADVRSVLESINGLVIELPQNLIPLLASEDIVQWIEPPLPKMDVVNDSNRIITQTNTVQAAPYNLDGSGVTVLVYDGGTARATHVDFQGRLSVHDSSGTHYHSTHVAGTVGGAGVANAAYKGMAPGVTMLSYGFEQPGGLQPGFLYTDPGDLEADYAQAILLRGADISNNSIGTNTAPNGYDCTWEGNYGATGVLIDTIVRGDGSNSLFTMPFRIVWANGNERSSGRCGTTYHTTAPPACAKNHITVGAMNSNDDSVTSFTSWGPTDDDRLKPDISAPGCQSNGDNGVTSCDSSGDTAYTTLCGTSMASPTVCGCSALLMQDYRTNHPGEPDFRNSTLKALLAHNAQDLEAVGPDYKTGYGSIRIQDTVDFMRTENFLEGDVNAGTTHSILVFVNPGDTELKITLAWDDVPGTPNVNPVLVNDLDLKVFDPSSQQHFPWTLGGLANPSAPAVRTQADHVNNIEQVVVDNPTPGAWRVEVYGYDVPDGPQPFSLCASPQLVACSPQGMIALDAPLYACTTTAEIRVVDCDLNTDDNVIETTTVTIASDSEPAGESVLLTETAAESADFRGTIAFDTANSPGVLLVADADTVTATYIDEDDGQGGYNVVVTATATVDCQGPAISNVQIAAVGSDNATVTFDTDENAVGTVRYGLDCGSLTQSATETGSGTSHTVILDNLGFNTRYYFAVDAVDRQGNPSTDDNGGSCYSFSTPNVAFDFPMNTNPGWTTAGQWAFGQPTGGGSYNGDPTSGRTGNYVYGYNLNGDYSDNLPATYLTTTALDCAGLTDVSLSFWRWLGVESNSNYDEATIEVSNNGTNWSVIWRATDLGVDVADTQWVHQEFDISAIADNQSTVYIRWGMGPTDGGLTYPGWNIDDVQIVATGGMLAMAFPNGLPEILAPGQPTNITVRIVEGDEQYLADSGMLHYRYQGGDFLSVPLVPLGGELYRATLPPATCSATPEFYFSAEGTASGVIYQPPTAPSGTYTADVGEFVTLFSDNFETHQGWTVQNGGGLTDGQWDRGIPVNCDRGDPPTDYDGSGQCYLTDNSSANYCNSDVDDGYTWLMSPTLDLSTGDAEIEYALWYSNWYGGDPHNDLFVVWVSNNNGANWTEADTFGPATSAGWAVHSFQVGDFVTPTSQVKVRFEAADFNAGSVVEAGIDAFEVRIFVCEDVFPVGDLDCDADVDFDDINPFVLALSGEAAYLAEYPQCVWLNADCNGDGAVDFDDINAFVALLGG